MKISNPKTDNAEEYDGQFREFSDEQVGLRVVEVGNRKFNVVQENPFNLWRIVPERGPVPEVLSGAYTTIDMASKAIAHYVGNKK